MNRIDKKFIELDNQGKKAFVAFVTAGDSTNRGGRVLSLKKTYKSAQNY